MNNTYINWLNEHLKNQSLLNEINWAAVNRMRGAQSSSAISAGTRPGGLSGIGPRIRGAIIGAAQRARGTPLVGTPAGGMRAAAAARTAKAQANRGPTSQDIRGLTQAIQDMKGGGGGSPTAPVTQQGTGSTARGQNIGAAGRVTSSQKPGTRPITAVTESLSNIVKDMIIKKINVRK